MREKKKDNKGKINNDKKAFRWKRNTLTTGVVSMN